jgi:hypothetical protein
MSSGVLRRELEAAATVEGWRLSDLTVLAGQNDPFMQDTPAGHRDGQWFAEQMARFVPHGALHLRGVHYRIVATADVLKPDGKPYTNTDEDWGWLQEHPAKAGRWLGYVPFGRIIDERNAEPEITIFEPNRGPHGGLSGGHCRIEVPAEHLALPWVFCSRLACDQPYRIILIGEKTSLGPVLRSLSGVSELLLPTGEISDTLIHAMAARAVEDGRPTVVLYFSDFDPAGHQMPISVSRKLQALRLLEFPSLSIEVHHVALTLDQVVALNLPSTPLKETERRANRWRKVMRREQTEIDALAALRPEVLRQVAREAIAPFWDATLERRAQEAQAEWTRQAEEELHSHPSYEPACNAIREALTVVEEAVAKLRGAQKQAEQTLRIALPRLWPVEPRIFDDTAPIPLFDSEADFATASRRLIDHKKLNGGAQ